MHMKKQETNRNAKLVMRRLQDLNLMDNFLFNKVLGDKKDGNAVARILIETILGRPIGRINVSVQKTFPSLDTDKKGSIMDLIVEEFAEEQDEENEEEIPAEVFDLEPDRKKSEKAQLPRRTRFYHSLIDRSVLPSGAMYSQLPDVYVIIITDFDPFDRDRIIYTVENRFLEEPELEYNDGIRTVYLNTTGSRGNVSDELRELLAYMQHTCAENAVNEKLRRLQGVVERIKSQEEVSIEYMKSWEEQYYLKKEAREEGLAEGRAEGREIGLAEGRAEERENTIREKERADAAEARVAELEAKLAELLNNNGAPA